MLLVSHDREFLDNVVTSTLVLEGNGRVGEYVGGYSDWLRQKPRAASDAARFRPPGDGRNAPASAASVPPDAEQALDSGLRRNDGPKQRRKLSYKDARELEQLPAHIEALEAEIVARTEAMQDPAFFKQENAAIVAANEALAELQAELDAAFERWHALEQ